MSVRASHLLIKHTGSRNPTSRRTNYSVGTTPEEAMTELTGLMNILLEKGVGEFAAMATKRSDCSSFKQGGDLGPFERGQMQAPFEEATFALKVGEMSGIVSTDSGYHLIYRYVYGLIVL
jgi:NIMA-interacting peptidyl-prolyl cis-trans isomerase 1